MPPFPECRVPVAPCLSKLWQNQSKLSKYHTSDVSKNILLLSTIYMYNVFLGGKKFTMKRVPTPLSEYPITILYISLYIHLY